MTTTKRAYIERVEIIGPKMLAEATLDYLYDNDYQTTRVGPVKINALEIDATRFHFIAERDVTATVVERDERTWNNPVLCIKNQIDMTEAMSDESSRLLAQSIWQALQPTIQAQCDERIAELEARITHLEDWR